MGKLRNANTDVGQFIQWLMRKCRNHHPLQELNLSEGVRESMPRMYAAKKKADVFVMKNGAENVGVYVAGGRTFEIKVTEIPAETYTADELTAVDY